MGSCPTQEIIFLGFILTSNHMTITLTPYGAQKLNDAYLQLQIPCTHALREVAPVLGLMTSSFPGVMYGPLHYRTNEMENFLALTVNKGNTR